MRFIFLLSIFVLVPTNVFSQVSAEGKKYIGYKYKGVNPGTTLPNGVKHLGGGLLGDVFADPVYGVSQVSKGKIKMLWFEVSTGQDAGGVTGWQVKDVLSFYNQRANDHILIFGDPSIECRRNGDVIENLFGIGRIIRKQAIFRPSTLWVANLKSKRFDQFSAVGVKCVYSEP